MKITCPKPLSTCPKSGRPKFYFYFLNINTNKVKKKVKRNCIRTSETSVALVRRTSATDVSLVRMQFLLVSDDRTSGISNPVLMLQRADFSCSCQYPVLTALMVIIPMIAVRLLWKVESPNETKVKFDHNK